MTGGKQKVDEHLEKSLVTFTSTFLIGSLTV